MFEKFSSRFFSSMAIVHALIEAVISVVILGVIQIYVIGNQTILNTSTTLGAIAVPIFTAVIIASGAVIIVMVLKSAAKDSSK
jgi:hypothetical protein